MENKIFNFQFRPVCVNQICPNYSVGSHQDEAEIPTAFPPLGEGGALPTQEEKKDETKIQYDRWSTQEWCSREKCEKMSIS